MIALLMMIWRQLLHAVIRDLLLILILCPRIQLHFNISIERLNC